MDWKKIFSKYINMDDNNSSYENDIDLMSTCLEMTNTIDALNTNIFLLNKFIESAMNILDNTYFKENVEITTFDSSGNVMTCVKTDGSGNFIPCVFMDLSHNPIQFVLPQVNKNSNSNRDRSFSPLSPYYYPYYSPYYSPFNSRYYNRYYNPYYSSLLDDGSIYRDIPDKKPMNVQSLHRSPYNHSMHNSIHYPVNHCNCKYCSGNHCSGYNYHGNNHSGNHYSGNHYPGNHYSGNHSNHYPGNHFWGNRNNKH
jgi:hypothetical protein